MLDLFEGSLAVGCVGLASLAALQLGHGGGGHHAGGHGLDAGHGHVGHIDAGHGHVGHIDAGHAHGGHIDAGHAHGGHSDISHAGHGDVSNAHAQAETAIRAPFWLIPSPIVIFSAMIGFGLVGMVCPQSIPGSWAIGIAAVGGLAFQPFLVQPYWEWFFKFASTPGTNLQGAVASKAVALTSFNARGRGLVRLTVDGQDRDVLARLMPGTPRGTVRKGDLVFVERADEDNSVLVSKPDSVANA
jgi:hypothetical protein